MVEVIISFNASSSFIVTRDSLDMGFLTAFKASPMTRKTCVGLPQMYLKIIDLTRLDLRHLSFDQAARHRWLHILTASTLTSGHPPL